MDLYARKIIAWVLSDTLEAEWVVEAIEKAKKERHADKPKVMHSDRGIQYTCGAYRETTEGWKLSCSKKAYPWDCVYRIFPFHIKEGVDKPVPDSGL